MKQSTKDFWEMRWLDLQTPFWFIWVRIRRTWRYWTDPHEKWIRGLKVGDIVCSCSYEHLPISVINRKQDHAELKGDSGSYSLYNCLTPIDAPYHSPHPTKEDWVKL